MKIGENSSIHTDESRERMKTKCHYNGPEFVPCEVLKQTAQDMPIIKLETTKQYLNATERVARQFNFCPFCGESIKPPEPALPWWLVPGIFIYNKAIDKIKKIEQIRSDGTIAVDDGYYSIEYVLKNYIIRGGPFDMIPEWATHIHFYQDKRFEFRQVYNKWVTEYEVGQIWHGCPEEFKGKTFSLEGLK